MFTEYSSLACLNYWCQTDFDGILNCHKFRLIKIIIRGIPTKIMRKSASLKSIFMNRIRPSSKSPTFHEHISTEKFITSVILFTKFTLLISFQVIFHARHKSLECSSNRSMRPEMQSPGMQYALLLPRIMYRPNTIAIN